MRQIPEEYIVKMEQDILDAEGIFVHTPSVFAKYNLFYVRLEALYTCGPKYEVQRSGLDSFLLFFFLFFLVFPGFCVFPVFPCISLFS